MKKSSLLINEPSLQVLPSLAVALGLEEAIALQQLHYWLGNAKNQGRTDADGNKWVYNTYAGWKADNFPFWSEDKIQRIFLSLEKQGVVIAAQLDAKKRDMKKFYRIDYDALCAMEDANLRLSNTSKNDDVNNTETTPETTTEFKDRADAPTMEKPPRDERPKSPKANQIPEVVLFRTVTKRYPAAANFDEVVASVRKVGERLQRAVEVEDLLKFYKSWTSKGYNPFNLAWLQWAEAGEVPQNGTWKPRNTVMPKGAEAALTWLQKQEAN